MGHLGAAALSPVERGAVFDDGGVYRYRLWRQWPGTGPTVVMVGLNPSTADAHRDDPTIRRCMGFARSWGCRRLEVVNLFAWRATRPAALRQAPEPVGPDNDRVLENLAGSADLLVACWGVHGGWQGRGQAVIDGLGGTWQCLGRTRDGHPRHPLYLRADTPLEPY